MCPTWPFPLYTASFGFASFLDNGQKVQKKKKYDAWMLQCCSGR